MCLRGVGNVSIHTKIPDILGVLQCSALTLLGSGSLLCLHQVNGCVLGRMSFLSFLFESSKLILVFLGVPLF